MTTAHGETSLVAYLDESRKPVRDRRTGRVAQEGQHYAVAAAVMFAGDADHVREALVAIAVEATGGHRLRWYDLGVTKRRTVVEGVLAIDSWEGRLYETGEGVLTSRTPDLRVRSYAVGTAFDHLSTEVGVAHAVLETRSQPVQGFITHDEQDRNLLVSRKQRGTTADGFTIEHQGKSESLLWLADILAGIRTDYLCWADRGTYPIVAHRVVSQVTVWERVPLRSP
jgi:hypothetical protein